MPRGHQQESRLAGAVRAARLRKGWSRERLAHESGLSWSAIIQIETGRRTDVRVGTLAALAEALEVSLDHLVRGAVAPTMLEHRAVLFDSPDRLADTLEPIIENSVKQDHAVVVVTTPFSVAAVKKKLGAATSKRVEFGDSLFWYRSPTSAAADYEAFARRAITTGSEWVDIIGEPVWTGRNRAETTAWMRYESLFNAQFATWPVSASCLYDTGALSDQVLADVERTHPDVVSDDSRRRGESYEEPMLFMTT